MATVEPLGPGRIESRELEQEMRSSFLDYAMSVIVSRALPDVRDGLKPVHRRVLYAMHEAGLQPTRARLKCARVVGDVMGSYHPHGDQSIYDTLVRLAQPFSMRYPLVDGQGNFGNIDGYPAAAMRYTECRLARLATEMLRDIDADTVDFKPNYDESRREPTVLPSRLPNLLLNGSSGIAVGMATNIPPHNLGEVVDALVAMIDEPSIDVDRLTKHVKGPGLPFRRDHSRPRGHPRGLPLGPRPDRAARAHPHRGAARRPHGDHRQRAPLRRPQGRRRGRDQEDRRPRQREGRSGGARRQGPLGQVRDADPDRAEARRDPAGRPEQALQAHLAPDDLRLQRGRAGRRRPEDAAAARHAPALPRLPARGHHPPLQVRAAQGRGTRACAPGLPDRARQPRRGHLADPRVCRPGCCSRRLDGDLRALGDPGAGDSRPPSPAADRPRAQADRGRVRRPAGADHRAPHNPRRRVAHRRSDPGGDPRAQGGLRQERRSPQRDRGRGGRARPRGPDRRGGHGDRDQPLRLHKAAAGDDLPRAAPRRDRRHGDGPEGRGLHRAPLRRLDARLPAFLHHRRQGLPAEGARAPVRHAPVEGARDREPAPVRPGRAGEGGDRHARLQGGRVPRARDAQGHRQEDPLRGVQHAAEGGRDHRDQAARRRRARRRAPLDG